MDFPILGKISAHFSKHCLPGDLSAVVRRTKAEALAKSGVFEGEKVRGETWIGNILQPILGAENRL
jgi:hypothetical protein